MILNCHRYLLSSRIVMTWLWREKDGISSGNDERIFASSSSILEFYFLSFPSNKNSLKLFSYSQRKISLEVISFHVIL